MPKINRFSEEVATPHPRRNTPNARGGRPVGGAMPKSWGSVNRITIPVIEDCTAQNPIASRIQPATRMTRLPPPSRRIRRPIATMNGSNRPHTTQSSALIANTCAQFTPPPPRPRRIASCAVKSRVRQTTLESASIAKRLAPMVDSELGDSLTRAIFDRTSVRANGSLPCSRRVAARSPLRSVWSAVRAESAAFDADFVGSTGYSLNVGAPTPGSSLSARTASMSPVRSSLLVAAIGLIGIVPGARRERVESARAPAPKLHLEEVGSDSTSFDVIATMIVGPTEVLVWDAQYHAAEARRLADRVAATGKHLKAVVISHPDHDHYSGAAAIVERFPGTPVYMTAKALAHFDTTKQYFQREKTRRPGVMTDSLVTPQLLPSTHLTVDGEELTVIPDLTGDVVIP